MCILFDYIRKVKARRRFHALRKQAIERINLYNRLESEVNKKRNNFLNNNVPLNNIIYLDFPEPMLILTLDEPIFNKFEFIKAISIFISWPIEDKEISIGEKKGWRYGKFYCPINDNKIYCDADLSSDHPKTLTT